MNYIEKYEELKKDSYLVNRYDKQGIYCILIDNKLVYIGKSKCMLKRIASHICCIDDNDKAHKYQILNQAKQNHQITFDVVLPVQKEADLGIAEGIYIRKYMPPLNYQIPKEENWRRFAVNKSAQTITLEQILQGVC